MDRLLQAPAYQNLSVGNAMRRWTTGTTQPTYDASGRPVGYDLPAMSARTGIDPSWPMASLSGPQRQLLTREMSVREGFSGSAPQPAAPVQVASATPVVAYPSGAFVDQGVAGPPLPAGPPPQVPAPITVRPQTPATPLAPVAPPPPASMWPGIPRDPVTKMPLETRTQQYQGGLTESYRAPERGSFEQQMLARYLGITDPSLIDHPQTVIEYFNWKQGLDDQAKIHAADIERMYQPTTPSEVAAVQRLNEIQNTVNHIVTTYTPDQIKYFVGIMNYPAHIIQQHLGVDWANKIAQFRTDIATVAPSTFDADAKNGTLKGPELGFLAPLALNPRDSASQFMTNLQGLSDGVRRSLAFRDFIQHVPPDQVSNPDVLTQFNRDFDRQLKDERLKLAQGGQPAPAPAAAPPPPPPPPPPPARVAPPASGAWSPTSTWVVQ
jgi:hypothetical protein